MLAVKGFETTRAFVKCSVWEREFSPSFIPWSVVSALDDCLNKDTSERKVVDKYPFNLQSMMNGVAPLIF